MNIRIIMLTLALLAGAMQVQLWLSEDGRRKTSELRLAAAEQRQQNQVQRERNAALNAEVVNLKESREAAEERARSNLGMIGKSETFYQVVPAAKERQPR